MNGQPKPPTPSRTPFHLPANHPSLQYSFLTPEETATRLRTDLKAGLSDYQDYLHRRSIHGLNQLNDDNPEPLYIKFLNQFKESPLILLLLGSAAVSLLMGNVDDAISITLAILIVLTVGFVQEYRSEKSLEALNKLVPHHAHLIRYGKLSTIIATQLVPGDLVRFTVGDRVPADIRLTESVDLEIDESSLTGENVPVVKSVDLIPELPPGHTVPVTDRKNIVFMGTLVTHGSASGIVIATAGSTEFGIIHSSLATIAKPKTPLQQSMDALGKQLSYVSFVVIGVIVIIGMVQGRHWLEMTTIGVSLAVAAIPEGLPIIVTVTLALGVLRMAAKRVIVRRLNSVETLGSVNVVCSDKTGTLTMNHMTITKMYSLEHEDILDVEKSIDFISSLPFESALKRLLRIGNLCNNAHLGEFEKLVGQATDVAIIDIIHKLQLEDIRPTHTRLAETPFSSDRKWMGVIAKPSSSNHEGEWFIKGAVEEVLSRCDTYISNRSTVVLDEKIRSKVLAVTNTMSEDGLRVLALASGRGIPDSADRGSGAKGLTFAGIVGMFDPPRPGVSSSIRRLLNGGVRVMMITGDSPTTALSIARALEIPMSSPGNSAILTGLDIDSLTDSELSDAISRVAIFARTTPRHKLKIIKALQQKGYVVAMTGDGVNDAPALKMADIGVSMGIGGTDVAKEAADMVLSDDDFSTILTAIEEGKGIFSNIQNFLTFQLSTSVAALSLVALSTTLGLPNPLNAMQILWINILMDGPPAQSLGVEPVDPAVMSRPPRQKNALILTPKVIKRVLTQASIILIGTMYVYVMEMKDGQVTARDTTMTFTAFVLFDMFNALTCRSATHTMLPIPGVPRIRLFSNALFNFAVSASLVGQLLVIYLPFLQTVFQTEAIGARDLAMLVCLASCVFWVDEGRKWWARRAKRGKETIEEKWV